MMNILAERKENQTSHKEVLNMVQKSRQIVQMIETHLYKYINVYLLVTLYAAR